MTTDPKPLHERLREEASHYSMAPIGKLALEAASALEEQAAARPVVLPDGDDPQFREAFEASAKASNMPLVRKGAGYRSSITDIAFKLAFGTVNRLREAARASYRPDSEQRPYGDLRNAKWLDPECYGAGACQSLKFKAAPAAAQGVQPLNQTGAADAVIAAFRAALSAAHGAIDVGTFGANWRKAMVHSARQLREYAESTLTLAAVPISPLTEGDVSVAAISLGLSDDPTALDFQCFRAGAHWAASHYEGGRRDSQNPPQVLDGEKAESQAVASPIPDVAEGGWCTWCGCGNDALGYAHLPTCRRTA